MNNKKITLVNPPYEQIAPGLEYVKRITSRFPSLGLLHLAAELRQHNYQPTIIESDIFDLDIQSIVERVIAEDPTYLGITLFTVGVCNAAAIAREIKERAPAIKIIVGGPHISSMGMETMQRFPQFDYAVLGEGERILTELLDSLELKGDLSKVAGIIYRDGPFTRQTDGRTINKNLDELAMPAWDLLPNFPKAYRPAVYDFPRGPVASIAASRGCPFHCKFCDTSTFGARVRYYSPAKVFEMMEHLHNQYGVRHIMFVDDLFLASRTRATELCNRLLQSNLKLTWSCTARVDTVRPDTLKLMKKAGCWEISFGLESGSNEMLQKMEKATEVEKSEQALKWTAEAGIHTKGLFMLGYPGENETTIQQTKDFVRRIPMTIMNLSKFTPYPGSPIYRDIYGTNIREDCWDKMNGMNFLWEPEGLSKEQLEAHYREILSSFYRRPGIGHHYIKLTLANPGHLLRLLHFGLGFLSSKIGAIFSSKAVTTEH